MFDILTINWPRTHLEHICRRPSKRQHNPGTSVPQRRQGQLVWQCRTASQNTCHPRWAEHQYHSLSYLHGAWCRFPGSFDRTSQNASWSCDHLGRRHWIHLCCKCQKGLKKEYIIEYVNGGIYQSTKENVQLSKIVRHVVVLALWDPVL